MSAPHLAVVGGGLAGLRAALSCADAGARVTLLEARARLGGATWSLEKRGLHVDNGQHVFMRCCTAYRELLERLGVSHKVDLQRRLAVPVAAPGRPLAWIRRRALPSPAHLAASLLGFSHLPFSVRLRAARAARRFAWLDPDDPALDARSLGEWLAEHGAGDAASLAFFDLLIRATLNEPAASASLALAAKVMRTGFLDRPDAPDIGIARVPFADLHGEPGQRALEAAGAELRLRAPVDGIRCTPGGVVLATGGAALEADAVILAAPHSAAAGLAPPEAGVDAPALEALGASPIVNLHLWLDRPVMPHAFVAGWNTPLQWTFDRSEAAGVDRGQLLSISLSAAGEWLGLGRAALRERFLPALTELFPAARGAELIDCVAVQEPAATFRQVAGSRSLRPGPATRHSRVWLAGAWTDTGWPATMEGAVRSGEAAARGALAALGLRGPGVARAA